MTIECEVELFGNQHILLRLGPAMLRDPDSDDSDPESRNSVNQARTKEQGACDGIKREDWRPARHADWRG